ncbi:hypothetical protein [Neorhizobium galegae]|uniref:hypothetical protein n=1 Tax=Neorhizobium galegae TaxID=399 RepID=UPI001275CA4F|nr:hypothetical protein [Neorhizobium galegae]KAA9383034.1 hypothetical protein F4V88_21990 [Neorhizobium galegae]MCM2499001.1 hypothetical protein [Neorhizobium galegae]
MRQSAFTVLTSSLAGFGATPISIAMTDVAPPLVPRGDENRHIFCQMAVFPPLQDVISAAERAGWNELETMAAITEVMDTLMLGAGTNAEVDELLKAVRRKME